MNEQNFTRVSKLIMRPS